MTDRPDRTLPDGVADGWSWFGKQSARFYAYHPADGSLPLHAVAAAAAALGPRARAARVCVQQVLPGLGEGRELLLVEGRAAHPRYAATLWLPGDIQSPFLDDIGASTPDANDRGRKTMATASWATWR